VLIRINSQDFMELDDTSLIWACIEPTIRLIRGKSFAVKSEVSAQLNESQRALLMFQVFYGHSVNGTLELLSHLSYLLSQKGVWTVLKNGMRYFGVNDMVHLLDEVEDVYGTLVEKSGKADPGWFDLNNGDIGPEIQMIIVELDKRIKEMMPEAVKSVGAYIRSHPDEFVQTADK
jgi:hypothetical protein